MDSKNDPIYMKFRSKESVGQHFFGRDFGFVFGQNSQLVYHELMSITAIFKIIIDLVTR